MQVAVVAGLIVLLVLIALLLWLFVFRARLDTPEPDPFEPDAAVEDVAPAELTNELRTSLAGGDPTTTRVVWTDLGDEVLVHLDSLAVEVRDGAIHASLDLDSDQTGRQTLTVPFAVGDRREDGAAVALTEDLPTGHAGLAARWGRSVQAALWSGVLDMARTRAEVAEGIPGRIWIEGGRVFFEASEAPTATRAAVGADAPTVGSDGGV